jgi:Ca2+-binding RTX toxin-like protein
MSDTPRSEEDTMPQRTTARLETLESRTLFANAHVLGEVLAVHGDRGATNTISVADSADGQGLDVDVTSVTRRGVTKTFEASFPKSLGYARVHVRGGQRADVINFGSEAAPFTIEARVNGFAGDDTINTGSGNDQIVGGNGADVIPAGAGNDTVRAGRGADQIFGEDGDDILWGGLGDDQIDAGSGNDKLGGVLGINKMLGGDGADEFLMRTQDQNPDNDFLLGTDTLTIRLKREDNANPDV